MKMLLVVAVLLALSAPVMAAGIPGLNITGGDAVWVQAVDGSPGSVGGLIGLKWPTVGKTDLDILPVLNLVKANVLFREVNGTLEVDPALSMSLETAGSVKFKVGVAYLPTVKYKTGWFVGMNLFTLPL
jgi:hypothetical protein